MKLAIFLLFALVEFQDNSPQKISQRDASLIANPNSVSRLHDERAVRRHNFISFRVHDFTDRIMGLRDVKVKTLALARLANLIWDEDEICARQIFNEALGLISANKGMPPGEYKLNLRDLYSLRDQVIAQIAKRDGDLAKRLIVADTLSDDLDIKKRNRRESNFIAANELLKDGDPKMAVEFVQRSLSDGVHPWMCSFLRQLRFKDEQAADKLFITVIDQLALDPTFNAEDLLLYGTYPFTSSRVDPFYPNAISRVLVDNLLVYDITADRPGVSTVVVRAYLQAATRFLTRPASDPKQRQMFYVTGHLLLPKANKFSPDLVPHIAAAMQSLTPVVPFKLTQATAYANFIDAPKDTEQALREVEKLPDQSRRDAEYLSMVSSFWDKGDFAQARYVASKIRDRAAAEQLSVLISFGEAAQLLKTSKSRNKLAQVEEQARNIPKGIERAVLWLAISHANAEMNNLQGSREAIDEALRAARSVDDARRPFLILNAASQLANYDTLLAKQTLWEAVKDFNVQKPRNLSEIDWQQRVESGRLSREFPLDVSGIRYRIDQVLPPLMDIDLAETIEAVGALKSEEQFTQGLLAVTAFILK